MPFYTQGKGARLPLRVSLGSLKKAACVLRMADA